MNWKGNYLKKPPVTNNSLVAGGFLIYKGTVSFKSSKASFR